MGRLIGAVAVIGALLGTTGCAGTTEARHDIQGMVPGVATRDEGLLRTSYKDRIEVVGMKSHPEAVSFEITADTQIMRDGQRVEVSELQPGMPVRVAFEAAVGPERATKIELLTGGDAAKVRTEARERGVEVAP